MANIPPVAVPVPVPVPAPEISAHGGLIDAELATLGLREQDVLDFSVNVNPYGPSPRVVEAIRAASLTRYPDPTARRARAALARQFDVPIDSVMVANGAVDLLWTIARACMKSRQTALVVEPAFSEFRRALSSVDAHIVESRTGEDFALRVDDIIHKARTHEARCVYLCTPGNPSGSYVAPAVLAELARAIAPALLIADQSFLSLTRHWRDAWVKFPENVVVVRSLTKDHALAGLRVGYLLAAPSIVTALEAHRPPWSTGALAEAAIVAICNDGEHVHECRERWLLERDYLRAELERRNFQVLPSETPYFLVCVGGASALRQQLLERHGLLVRDCSSFGLSQFIRVCARPREDSVRLVRALSEEI